MSTKRAAAVLVLLVAAVTGGPIEEVSHWNKYGESRLQEALNWNRQVRTNN
jgi:hypothetical protein